MADAALAPSAPTDEILLASARDEVERFRERRKQSAEGNEEVQESVDSFQFGNMGLQSLPEKLVDIIKDEAVRLALDRNKLTGLSGLNARFSEFKRLKYLVLRNNQLKEFPAVILTVPTIESLDLKGNQIQALPEDLSRLTRLKNFSVRQNEIKKLPICIGKMNTLQRLTTRHNPITFPPKHSWKVRDRNAEDEHDERLNDIKETKALKKYLGDYTSRKSSRTNHTETDLTDMTVETPRPLPKRAASGRFPIRPSNSSIDISATLSTQPPPPPVSPLPSKSAPIIQKNSSRLPPTPISAIRPEIDAISQDNERNRSQSESHLYTSKQRKRMGIQMSSSKGSKEFDIDTLNLPSQSADHARGYSNGSVTAVGSGTDTFHNSSGSGSPTQQEPPRSALLSRLSNVQESRRKSTYQDPYLELVQGISFSMEQVHGPVKQLINLIKVSGAKPRSLERCCFGALTSMNALNRQVLQIQILDEDKEEDQPQDKTQRRSTLSVQDSCRECVASFESLISALFKELRTIVERANPRIVRTLMHLLFASSLELRNSYARFVTHFGTSLSEINASQRGQVENSIMNDSNITSPVPRPTTSLRIQDSRNRRNPSTASDLNKPLPMPRSPNPSYGDSLSYTGTTIRSNNSFNSVNGTGHHGQVSKLPYTPSLTPSASFNTHSTYGDFDGFEDYDEDQQFDFIFKMLSVACDQTIQGLSKSSLLLADANQKALNSGAPQADVAVCNHASTNCKLSLDATDDLLRKLRGLNVQEPHIRTRSDFWQSCTAFTKSYFLFAHSLKTVTKLGFLSDEIKPLLKPVQRAVKNASAAIDASPWRDFAVPHGRPPVRRRPHPHNSPAIGLQTRGIPPSMDPWEPSSAVSSNGLSSGYQTPLPATPQSAALGPAVLGMMSGVAAASGPVPNGPQLPSSYFPSAASLERSRSVSQRR